MNEIKLIIDGKEYICRPVEETGTEESERQCTGYERVQEGKGFNFVGRYGIQDYQNEQYRDIDNGLYKIGNYYNNTQLARDIARAETLMRRMRQWQALNDEAVDWTDVSEKYYIYFDYTGDELGIESHDAFRDFGQVYFSTVAKAEEAATVFHNDLMWYFTEYRQRLDEPIRSDT